MRGRWGPHGWVGTAESLGWGGGGALPSPSPSVRACVSYHCELGAHTLHLLGRTALSQQSRPLPIGPAPAPGPSLAARLTVRSCRMDFICSQAA